MKFPFIKSDLLLFHTDENKMRFFSSAPAHKIMYLHSLWHSDPLNLQICCIN